MLTWWYVLTYSSQQSRYSVATWVISLSIGDVSGDEIASVVAASVGDEANCDADPVVASFVDVEVEESDRDAWYASVLFLSTIFDMFISSIYSATDNMKVDWEVDSGRDTDSVGVAPGGRIDLGDEEDDESVLSDVNNDGSVNLPGADISKHSAWVFYFKWCVILNWLCSL